MRHAAIKLGCATAYALVLASAVMVPGAIAQDTSAHALAEKFSRAEAEEEARAEQARQAEAARKAAAVKEAARRKAAEAEAARQAEAKAQAQAQAQARAKAQAQAQAEAERQRLEAQRRADEAEMLRQARAEAEARRAAEVKAEAVRAEAERAQAERAEAERAEAARIVRESQERQRQAAEKARLEAEREAARAQAQRLAREAEQRRQAEARRAEEARKAEAQRMAREVEKQRQADERESVEAQLLKEQTELEDKRQQELSEIAAKFRLAREARERAARQEAETARIAKKPDMEETRTSLGGPLPVDTNEHAPERVSVLLIVEPRRPGKATNPVLCIEKSCYISGGADDAADRVTRDHALGPGNTIGRRAGPCNKQRTCIYRNVYLGQIASIQPVDLGFWGHKRHDIYTVRPDKSCDVIKGRLFCASPVIGHGYRAWIVPEEIAARAGARALEAALAEGLPPARSAALDTWTSTVRQDR